MSSAGLVSMTGSPPNREGAAFEPLDMVDPTLADALFGPDANLADAANLALPRRQKRAFAGAARLAGVGDLLASFAAGSLTPVDVVGELAAAIETDPSGPEAVVAMVPGAAEMAARSASRWASGKALPLDGIPFGIKDIIDVEGATVSCGSLLTGARLAPRDAAAVASLRRAGAIPFAITATTEFAAGLPDNRRFGAVTNPWDGSRWSGGSSTGSGAALAARLLPLALGTDTAGSIRVPSCWCGTTGLKPSRELVSRAGIASLSWTLDHVGPMARSAADITRALPFMTASPDAGLAGDCARLLDDELSLGGLRIGIPVNWFAEMVDGPVSDNWQAALATMEQLGGRIVELPPLPIGPMQEAGWTILLSELAANHADRLGQRDLLDHGVLARLLKGMEIRAADYGRALAMRKTAQDVLLAAMDGVDFIVTPGVGGEAGSLGSLTVEVGGVSCAYQDIAPRNTLPFNLTGFPALMLPSGLGAAGLPTGIQIAARPRADAVCLRAGMAFQRATDHHRNRPSRLGSS